MSLLIYLVPILISYLSILYWTYRRTGYRAKHKNAVLSSLQIYYYSYSIINLSYLIILIIANKILIYNKLLSINPHVALPLYVSIIILCCYRSYNKFIYNVRPRIYILKILQKIVKKWLFAAAILSIIATLTIILSIFFEAIRFFSYVSPLEFLFGLNWSPSDGSEHLANNFGAVPVFAGTLLITFIAILVAAPLGLLSSLYLTEYSSKKIRLIIKPMLELLAGIPTIVYGYFAALTVGPMLRDFAHSYNIDIASESALGAGLVMGIMIIPFILSITDDVINAVPKDLREASLALGATKAETIIKVVIPAALPGIIGAILLAISRAIGETMIVTMAAGLQAKLTLNPLSSVTTVTAQIVSLIGGDQEFESVKTLSAFALALTLFFITLLLNIIAQMIVKKYREQYE
jgi:phosphate transport system permease protein